MMTNTELIAARHKRGWTQKQLAEKLGVTPTSVWRWEQPPSNKHSQPVPSMVEAYLRDVPIE